MNMLGMLNRVLLAAALSWGFSITLGLLYAASASGSFSLSTLRLPGVVPVALILGTEAALAITPIAIWSLRTGMKNLSIYGPILWLVLAGYVLVAGPSYGPYAVLALAALGLIVLGFIPPSR